jgi:hypothetical protein
MRIGLLCASAGRAKGVAPSKVAVEANIAPRRVMSKVVSPKSSAVFPLSRYAKASHAPLTHARKPAASGPMSNG